MRFLKNKIAAAQAFQAQKDKLASVESFDELEKKCKQEPDTFSVSTETSAQEKIEKVTTRKPKTTNKKSAKASCGGAETARETKNLVKNYGKAICNFCSSSMAVPYLSAFVENEGVNLEGFLEFTEKSKSKIDGLHHFREMLLSTEKDSEKVAAYRRIYKQISEVFIKFFSVNWIFDSKVKYKKAHLNFRFKMLRRIKSPELFTYLKGPKGNSNKTK